MLSFSLRYALTEPPSEIDVAYWPQPSIVAAHKRHPLTDPSRRFIAGVTVCYWAEAHGNDALTAMGLTGGNMEGREVRFGIVASALFAIQLVEVEAAFKTMKDDLNLRPIYHQLEQRVEAHIFVAFLTYCLHVTLRARLKPLAPGLTPRASLDKFVAVQMIDVHFPTTDGRTLVMSRYTEFNVDQKHVQPK